MRSTRADLNWVASAAASAGPVALANAERTSQRGVPRVAVPYWAIMPPSDGYGTSQLEEDGAWAILAELEGMSLDDYLLYAVEECIITKVAQLPEDHCTQAILAALRERAHRRLPSDGGYQHD